MQSRLQYKQANLLCLRILWHGFPTTAVPNQIKSNKHDKELSPERNIEAVIDYSYLYDDTISSPATSGSSQTILDPIKDVGALETCNKNISFYLRLQELVQQIMLRPPIARESLICVTISCISCSVKLQSKC